MRYKSLFPPLLNSTYSTLKMSLPLRRGYVRSLTNRSQAISMLSSTIDEAATGLESIICHLPAVVGGRTLNDGEQESVQDRSRRSHGPPRKIARSIPYSCRTSRLPIYCMYSRSSLDPADGMASEHCSSLLPAVDDWTITV